jgi:hypothetical protein
MGTDYIVADPAAKEFIRIGKIGNWFGCLINAPVEELVEWLGKDPISFPWMGNDPNNLKSAARITAESLGELKADLLEEGFAVSEREWSVWLWCCERTDASAPAWTYLLSEHEEGYHEIVQNWTEYHRTKEKTCED